MKIKKAFDICKKARKIKLFPSSAMNKATLSLYVMVATRQAKKY